MKWSEILAEIKRSLKEPEDKEGHWKDSELLRRANLVQADVCKKSFCIRKTDTLTLDTTVFKYPKPQRCINIVEVLFNNIRIKGTTEDQIDSYAIAGRSTKTKWREVIGAPVCYIDDYTDIFLYPNPQDATAILEMTYYSLADNMTTNDSLPFNNLSFLEDEAQLIIDGVLMRCFLEDKDDRYSVYQKLYKDGLVILISKLRSAPDNLESFELMRPKH